MNPKQDFEKDTVPLIICLTFGISAKISALTKWTILLHIHLLKKCILVGMPSTPHPLFQDKEEGKDQGSIQLNTTPDPGHHMGSHKNTRKHHIQESQAVSPFLADDHNAARNRQISMTDKHK